MVCLPSGVDTARTVLRVVVFLVLIVVIAPFEGDVDGGFGAGLGQNKVLFHADGSAGGGGEGATNFPVGVVGGLAGETSCLLVGQADVIAVGTGDIDDLVGPLVPIGMLGRLFENEIGGYDVLQSQVRGGAEIDRLPVPIAGDQGYA